MNTPTDEQLSQLNARIAELVQLDQWVIMKAGGYYRPNARGYTSSLVEAWKLPKEQAKQYEMYVDCDDVSPNDRVVIMPAPSPDYTGSLDAIHEAEKALLKGRLWSYRETLERVVGNTETPTYLAEAWQRAIALDRTLSKEPLL